MINGDEHAPHRPSWDCQQCGQAWPCAPAKVCLAEVYVDDRGGLRKYAGALFFAAAAELVDVPPAELRERMLGWTR